METNMAQRNLLRRIDAIGWGLLFLMTGTLALIPGLPDGTWLVGLGVLMLGLNATRLFVGLPLDRFGMIVGSGAVVAGLGIMAGIDVPVFALLLIVCGVAIIAGQVGRGAVGARSASEAFPHN
jgi:hypothetical protein